MSKKHKKCCRVLNYVDHLFIVISTITGCVSISAFASLVGIPIGITSSATRSKTCPITARITWYKSIIKKKKKKHDKVALLAKPKLRSIDVLISKALIYSNISHDEFILINNVLHDVFFLLYNMMKEFYNIKGEIKNSNSK